MSKEELAEALEKALEECRVYNTMGGLDEAVMADIAHDFKVDLIKLRDAFYE